MIMLLLNLELVSYFDRRLNMSVIVPIFYFIYTALVVYVPVISMFKMHYMIKFGSLATVSNIIRLFCVKVFSSLSDSCFVH
jgi:hypothetical protein